MTGRSLTRRQALRGLVGLGATTLLASVACQQAAPAAPTAAPAKPTTAPTTAPAKPAAAATAAPAAPAAKPAEAAKPAAAAPAAARPAVTPTGTLTYAQQLLPVSLDPHVEFVNSSFTYLYSLYDPLTLVDQDGKLQPYLATSWKAEGPTTWFFEMRKEATWHDGSPVTANDVKWSVERFLNPDTKSGWRAVYTNIIDRIDVVNDNAFRVQLKTPSVAIPYDVARWWVLPRNIYEKVGKDAFFEKPVGSGPYRFVRAVKGERLELEANEQYWNGAPRIKTLVFKQVPDASTRVAEALSGASDVVDAIPPNEIARINASQNTQMVVFPTVRRILLDMAIETTPELKDVRVRKAIAHAIDYDAINQAIYDGKAGKQTGWLDRFSWGYNKDLKPLGYDPARARALLTEAGYANGLPLQYWVGKGRFLGDEDVALAVTDYLNKAGFKVDLKIQEFAVFQAARARKEYRGIYMLSSGNSLGDPDQVSRALDSKRESLYVLDPELDNLIRAQQSEVDTTKRAAAVAAMDTYIHENALSLNLMTVPGFFAVNKRVEGFRPSPYEIHTFYGASVK